MNWRYRGFTADAKAGTPRIATRAERIGRELLGFRWTCDIDFQLQADDADELEARIVAFEANCSVDGGDWEWLYPNGTASIHSLRNGDTVGGIQIARGPTYDRPQPGEMTTFRNCGVGFSAIINRTRIPVGTILQLEEEIEVDNPLALPARMLVELQRAPAVWVKPRTHGIATIRQTGFVTTFGTWPKAADVPPPRWPNNVMPQNGGYVRRYPGAIRVDGIPAAFRIGYSYIYGFNAPVSGSVLPKII